MYKSKAKAWRRCTCSSERWVGASATFSIGSICNSDENWLVTWDSLKETDWVTELLSLVVSKSETDALIDWLADNDSEAAVVPKTRLSEPTRPVDRLVSDSIPTSPPFSSATTGLARVVAPARAPRATIPFKKELGTGWNTDSKGSAIFSHVVAWGTWKSPNCEMDARTQVFPDLINLKRVIRSVSRNSPFKRLKNMPAP